MDEYVERTINKKEKEVCMKLYIPLHEFNSVDLSFPLRVFGRIHWRL